MNELNLPRIPSPMPFLKRCATVFKMAGVAILLLLLLIPLGMIRSVLSERWERRNQAVEEITSSWGREQQIVGPVLIVPYRYAFKSWKERPIADGKIEKVEVIETAVANAYFLPAKVAIDGDIKPTHLRRGIYQAVVYDGRLNCSAEFARPDFASLRIEEKDVLWDDALVTYAIPDLRGVKETLQLQWGSHRVALSPGSKLTDFPSGVFARVSGLRETAGPIQSQLALTLNGSGGIRFAPVGAQNTVSLTSSWPDPSFQGAFLPADRKVTRDGFTATWQVSHYGRNYAQQWTDRDPSGLNSSTVGSSLFGVNFLSGIDAYRNVERAIKYGALFLVLVFAAFFLFEILSALRIHPFQYAIVGVAFCLFYLGLLSLSEFMAFGPAYFAAAAVTTLLIWFYCLKALQSGRRALIILGLLAVIFGFLYIALQLQDYSLLFGTAGLFAVLAVVIYATRNIDWYARDRSNSQTAP
ncbi:MAG TPA: cell envelope integrity protein CreD [Candidatus Paceibacterota bacterium]|nr:cell envelope integrity protein CreD [Candidatus Paceibacterota bacterium]